MVADTIDVNDTEIHTSYLTCHLFWICEASSPKYLAESRRPKVQVPANSLWRVWASLTSIISCIVNDMAADRLVMKNGVHFVEAAIMCIPF